MFLMDLVTSLFLPKFPLWAVEPAGSWCEHPRCCALRACSLVDKRLLRKTHSGPAQSTALVLPPVPAGGCCAGKGEPESEASRPISPRCTEEVGHGFCRAVLPPPLPILGRSQLAIQRAGGLIGGIQIADPSWPHLPLQSPV